jgi:acyl-CoA thioesterase II
VQFATMMALEAHGPDTFVGIGPRYPWGGLYGGQIVAQGLRAAGLTVDPEFHVHSLHAYFIRKGDHTEPIRFEVDRVRNGRSFVTRRVIARQAVGAILSMEASFQVDEDAPEVQIATLPDVPAPGETSRSEAWTDLFERRFTPLHETRGRANGWLRMNETLDDDPLVHACALAYTSDDLPTDAARALRPDRDAGDLFGTSLDHAVWFHRPARADEWLCHDLVCHGLISSRGLSVGHVFTADGIHVATVSQEVLLRRARPTPPGGP